LKQLPSARKEGHVVLSGTPEHGTPEHRNITEHSGTPEKPGTPPKKTGTTQKNPEHPQKKPGSPPKKPGTPLFYRLPAVYPLLQELIQSISRIKIYFLFPLRC